MNRFFRVILAALTVAFSMSAFSQNTIGIFTSRYDNQRTGQNREEPFLSPKKVTSTTFGKVFSYSVDGQVYAQPLWVMGVKIPGQGTHNVVYVVTQNDSVYAFDATGKTTTPLWQDSFIDLANGIEPVPCGTDGGGSDISCGVYPFYGITGTPVIDSSTNTMYLVARTYNLNTNVGYQTLHALDITSGAEKFGGPVQVSGSVPGNGVGSQNGMIYFNTLADIQRAGLLLLNENGTKTVYIGWAGAAHGWIMGYNATTLAQTAIFATTPNYGVGGIWASGNGLAADSSGNIYAAVGDAQFDANTGGPDYGDTLMQMNSSLSVTDYFTPLDQGCRQENDMDLGSSGPMILPTQGGTYPDEVIQSGKGGNPCDTDHVASLYLVDRDNMGKYNANQDNIIQEVEGAPAGYWSSPAYWSTTGGQAIYYGGVTAEGGSGDYLKMYTLRNGVLSTAPYAQSSNLFPVGTTPTVSSYGNNNGIVWAIQRSDSLSIEPGQQPATLYAFNALNLATLYSSSTNFTRDFTGCANKFQVPTVADGKVFVATQNELDVFGLLGPAPAVSLGLKQPCYTFDKQNVGTSSGPEAQVITNTGTAALSVSNITITGLNSGDFSQTNNCPASLNAGQFCTVKIVFTPSAVGPRFAQMIITDNANNSPQNTQLMGRGVSPQ
jgi:hypothetical protein